MIEAGKQLPAGQLSEYLTEPGEGCSIGPNRFEVQERLKGKKVVIFGLPGAFTPTCSAKHLPGYLAEIEQFRAKGVDEVWCFAVNDAFVMHAWGEQQGASGKVAMIADGSADYTRALGLELDLAAHGMGLRCKRFAMIVEDGVVRSVDVEAPGQFTVSDATSQLARLG